jgi:microcystin-dependent protein
MSSPFLAEIRMFAGNFAPKGWAFCNGQLLAISQNTALFSLLGTSYGGDGRSTFALPNLQGATPLMAGQGNGLTLRDLGETGGQSNVTLLQTEMPIHTHAVGGTTNVGGQLPANNVWSKPSQRGIDAYQTDAGTNPALSPNALSSAGGGQPHNNLMPYLVVSFIIALQGIYPSRN